MNRRKIYNNLFYIKIDKATVIFGGIHPIDKIEVMSLRDERFFNWLPV